MKPSQNWITTIKILHIDTILHPENCSRMVFTSMFYDNVIDKVNTDTSKLVKSLKNLIRKRYEWYDSAIIWCTCTVLCLTSAFERFNSFSVISLFILHPTVHRLSRNCICTRVSASVHIKLYTMHWNNRV